MRDKQKEEELRSSNDPKYQHLQEELHVEITAFAPPAEAHARIAFALTEVRKYLIPDSNDEIRQEQMRELEMISVNGHSVLDTLKQHSQAALLLNSGISGLGTSSLPPPPHQPTHCHPSFKVSKEFQMESIMHLLPLPSSQLQQEPIFFLLNLLILMTDVLLLSKVEKASPPPLFPCRPTITT